MLEIFNKSGRIRGKNTNRPNRVNLKQNVEIKTTEVLLLCYNNRYYNNI